MSQVLAMKPVHAPTLDPDAPAVRRATKRKVVILNPGGLIQPPRRIKGWTADSYQRDATATYNAGDLFVDEATMRLLDYDDLSWINIDAKYDQKLVDRVNEEAAYCIVRGSNYIHHQVKWGDMLRIIEAIKVPVVAFGVGAQAPKLGEFVISPETTRFLNLLSDKSHTIGVRGAFTAETLNDLGIKNVDVIGCPSLMRQNRPSLDITVKNLPEVRYVGLTLTRGVWPMYCQNIPKTRALQRELMLDYAKRYDFTIISQGEQPERAYWYRLPREMQAAYDALIKDKWFTGPDDPLIDIYRTKMFFGPFPQAYEDLVKQLDLVVGFRLHGNVMALANGVPAVYVVYDMRMREVVQHFDVPAYEIMDEKPFSLEELYTQARFDRFNARYREAYRHMAAFLDANGVAHLMRP